MLYIAENLKSLRKGKDLTQEDVAEMLNVSPQSVSKWERGDTYPDITLLPALANLYKTSVDALIGMEKINGRQARNAVFTTAHKHLRNGDIDAAVEVFSDALAIFPNDEGIMSDLAMSLAFSDNPEKLSRSITLCERVLSGNQGKQVYHTTRAALCFIYLKAGEKEKALEAANNLPHIRESREMVLEQIAKEQNTDEILNYLKLIIIGEGDEQDLIAIDFGLGMIPVATDFNLLENINALRGELGRSKAGLRKLPMVRVRDNGELSPNQVRVRHYANYLLDKEFANPSEAAIEIMAVLQKIVIND